MRTVWRRSYRFSSRSAFRSFKVGESILGTSTSFPDPTPLDKSSGLGIPRFLALSVQGPNAWLPAATINSLIPGQVLQYVLQFDPRIRGFSCRLVSFSVAGRVTADPGKYLKRMGKR